MTTPNPYARIAAALALSSSASEADCLEAIDKLRPPGDDLIRAILDGEIEGITYNPAEDTLTHELAEPLRYGDVEIECFTYRRAKTRDIRLAAQPAKGGEALGSVEISVRLWARLSGQAASALDDTCPEDIATFGRIVPFLQEPRRRISAALERG